MMRDMMKQYRILSSSFLRGPVDEAFKLVLKDEGEEDGEGHMLLQDVQNIYSLIYQHLEGVLKARTGSIPESALIEVAQLYTTFPAAAGEPPQRATQSSQGQSGANAASRGSERATANVRLKGGAGTLSGVGSGAPFMRSSSSPAAMGVGGIGVALTVQRCCPSSSSDDCAKSSGGGAAKRTV